MLCFSCIAYKDEIHDPGHSFRLDELLGEDSTSDELAVEAHIRDDLHCDVPAVWERSLDELEYQVFY
jgi:hypothetical protein